MAQRHSKLSVAAQDPEAFFDLPDVPSSEVTDKGAVVFLISPMAGAPVAGGQGLLPTAENVRGNRTPSLEDAILRRNGPFCKLTCHFSFCFQ